MTLSLDVLFEQDATLRANVIRAAKNVKQSKQRIARKYGWAPIPYRRRGRSRRRSVLHPEQEKIFSDRVVMNRTPDFSSERINVFDLKEYGPKREWRCRVEPKPGFAHILMNGFCTIDNDKNLTHVMSRPSMSSEWNVGPLHPTYFMLRFGFEKMTPEEAMQKAQQFDQDLAKTDKVYGPKIRSLKCAWNVIDKCC